MPALPKEYQASIARRETYSKKDEREGRGTYGQSKGPQGWTTWVRRAIEAINEERAVGTNTSPNDYLRTYCPSADACMPQRQ